MCHGDLASGIDTPSIYIRPADAFSKLSFLCSVIFLLENELQVGLGFKISENFLG
jgi:hypothetical protein